MHLQGNSLEVPADPNRTATNANIQSINVAHSTKKFIPALLGCFCRFELSQQDRFLCLSSGADFSLNLLQGSNCFLVSRVTKPGGVFRSLEQANFKGAQHLILGQQTNVVYVDFEH